MKDNNTDQSEHSISISSKDITEKTSDVNENVIDVNENITDVNENTFDVNDNTTEVIQDLSEKEFLDKCAVTKKKKKRILKTIGIVFVGLLVIFALIIGTKGGRKIIYKFVSEFIYNNVESAEVVPDEQPVIINGNNDDIDDFQETTQDEKELAIIPEVVLVPREENYVSNYLIFGIEEFEGAKNADTIMIASINTKDDTIKLTSLLRDSYVKIPGHSLNKLNSVYAMGGAKALVETIEQNYLIKINGYASVNFDSFEKIVNYLGGISIRLGEEEAHYLNTTNYISIKSNRNVNDGINNLNGNQVLGYSRVRRCVTLGGANDDYGRTVRQQRVLTAIFDKYKSQSLYEFFRITKDCLGFVTTDLDINQIEKVITDIVENKITTLQTLRIPVNGTFDDPKMYNGLHDPLILDWDANRKKLYSYIFLDMEEVAETDLATP